MSEELDLVAEIRDEQGKGASRRLRRQGKVPAILYGGGKPPRPLTLDHDKVVHQMEEESFFSSILTIKAGENTQPAIIKDVQRHPARNRILHLDLQRVVADEKIRMNVPIHYLNEDTAVGVKAGGVVSRHFIEVEVSCLPADLPEYFEVDIGGLEVDQMLHLSDIKAPEGVEIIELSHGEGHDQPIVAIHIPKKIEEPEEDEAPETEVIADRDGDDTETDGDAPSDED